MKKLILIFGLLLFFMGASAQWESFYNTSYKDSVETADTKFIAEDVDSTHVVYRSSLDSIYKIEPIITAGGLTISPTELSYIDGVTSNIQTQLGEKLNEADTVELSSVAWLLNDTIVLGSFSKDTTRTTDLYGSFYNNGSDTLVVTEMMAVLQGTTPSVTVDVQWHATFNSGSATQLNNTPPTITSTTTGDSDTSFDNSEIPPGVFVWMETPTVTTAATYISVTLLGYRKNASY